MKNNYPSIWSIKKVGEIAHKPQYGYTASAQEEPVGPRFIRITDITNGKIVWNEVPFCKCPEDIVEKYLLKSGDILFARTGTTGSSILITEIPEPSIFASYLIRLQLKKDIDHYYLKHFFNSENFWKQINRLKVGAVQSGINASVLSSIQVLVPPLVEQRGIVEVLSTVDGAIQQTDAVIEKTEELKRGLMQRLLTRGIGHKEFKQTELGEIPDTWEIKKIGEICYKPQYGYTASATYEPIGPKFLRITDIKEGIVNWEDVPYCSCPEEAISKYRLHKGDLVFTRTGATTGKSYLIKENKNAIFASYLIRLKTRNDVEHRFLSVFFNSIIYWKQINLRMVGSAQGGVNAKVLSNIIIPLPPKLEQEKIADIIFRVDEKIQSEHNNKETLDKLKRGLMQVLLKGKIRVRLDNVGIHRIRDC